MSETSTRERRRMGPEEFTKAAAAVALLLYVVGLIAVNEYLAPYGASDFALLRARFVYTGALALTPLLITSVGSVLVQILLAARVGGTWYKKPAGWRALLLIAVPFLAGIWFVFAWAIGSLGNQSSGEAGLHALTLVAAALVLALLVQTAFWLRYAFTEISSLGALAASFVDAFFRPVLLFFSLVAGVVMVLAFAFYLGKVVDDVYPIVPEQFGGARPVMVAMSLTTEGVAALHRLEPGVDETTYQAVQLLFEGEDYYLFRLPIGVVAPGTEPVFRMQKSLVTVVAIGT